MIKRIEIDNFWDNYFIDWKDIDPQVNILVGINGSGKSTLLNLIEEALSKKNNISKKTKLRVKIEFENTNLEKNPPAVLKVNTFDIQSSKASKSTNLDIKLEHLTFKKETANSMTFLDYRLNMLDKSMAEIERYKNRIDDFFNLINNFFIKTNKRVIFDKTNNAVKFAITIDTTKISAAKDDLLEKDKVHIIELSELSSGEKQLLILFFTLFLQDQKPCVILLDEPEISLHIEWQSILIETLVDLNPNAQFIIVTHSPSIFGDGWGDKLIFMEDIFISSKSGFLAQYLALANKDLPDLDLSLEEIQQLMLSELTLEQFEKLKNGGEGW